MSYAEFAEAAWLIQLSGAGRRPALEKTGSYAVSAAAAERGAEPVVSQAERRPVPMNGPPAAFKEVRADGIFRRFGSITQGPSARSRSRRRVRGGAKPKQAN